MAGSSNADTMVSGLKVSDILLPHPSLPNSMCLGPRSSESPAHLISCEANRIPFVNQHLDLTSWADCLRAWPNPPEGWVSWNKTAQLPSKLMVLPSNSFLRPLVLFVEFATSEESYNGRPTDLTKSAPKNKASWGQLPPEPRPGEDGGEEGGCQENPTRRTPAQASLQINETSSGVVEEVPMPSTPGPSNSPRVTDHSSDQHTAKPIVTTSASLPFLGEGCDPSSLLTFDPDSIEPAAPKIGEEPNLGAVDGPLQRLKVLLSSPVDTLVEDPETIRGILVDIQPRLPVVLDYSPPRPTPARADIAEKCQRLNEKKAADAKTATSTHSARLETLRKELEDLERRARETKQLIQDEESLIARSQEEAQGRGCTSPLLDAAQTGFPTGADEFSSEDRLGLVMLLLELVSQVLVLESLSAISMWMARWLSLKIVPPGVQNVLTSKPTGGQW
ncbi:hypothetical protein QYE76_050566 [Lolium multiflorum]|uniref:Uncharacterized protein n=1 Tax=Lolium multiflorum TaxID=4521 RepID=A0AAD8WH38_LOLMU|nr:hypothetical protein QYE76_050566 [Lolium multiflorum]